MTEKFVNKIEGETVSDRTKRVHQFLTEQRLQEQIDKFLSIKGIAQALGVSQDFVSKKLKQYELETKTNQKPTFENTDRIQNLDVDLDKLPIPQTKTTEVSESISEIIIKDDLVILGILAYTRPGKKVIEKAIALLHNNFAKNIANYIGGTYGNYSNDEIKNANYIMARAKKLLLVSI